MQMQIRISMKSGAFIHHWPLSEATLRSITNGIRKINSSAIQAPDVVFDSPQCTHFSTVNERLKPGGQ